MLELNRAGGLASARGRAPAASASGSRTTWTGRCRATATGARRCRSGSATSDPSHVEVIGSYAELAERWGRPLPDDFDPHKPFIDGYTWACSLRRHSCAARPR